MTWKEYPERKVTPDEAIDQGIPEEPVRFIEALSLVSRDQINNAQRVLEPINTKDYRNLYIDKVIEFSK